MNREELGIDDSWIESMKEAEKELEAMEEFSRKRNARILKAIKTVKGEEFYNCLLYGNEKGETYDKPFPNDSPMSDISGDLSFVRNPVGDKQSEDYGLIREVWVDQYCGYCGDDFHGTICVQLKVKLWLVIPFSC